MGLKKIDFDPRKGKKDYPNLKEKIEKNLFWFFNLFLKNLNLKIFIK